MKFVKTEIPGCFQILPNIMEDTRGKFVKTFSADLFEEHKLESRWKEEFFSVSKKGVLRGMHFQLPPHAHTKLVYCLDGEVLDVLVDLREGSPVYGEPVIFNLSSKKNNILYVPIGIAHGFYTKSDLAIVVYKTSTAYAPDYDAGISWQSVDVWPDKNPVLSERDSKHPILSDFITPFVYKEN